MTTDTAKEKDLAEILETGPTDTSTFGASFIQYAAPTESSTSISSNPHIPSLTASAVLGESYSMPKGTPIVKGYEFSNSTDKADDNDDATNNDDIKPETSNPSRGLLDDILSSYATMGFQASNVSLAIKQIKAMRKWRLSDLPYNPDMEDISLKPMSTRANIRARIFFSYTSNQISCGQREVIKYMVQNKMVDVIVTTAGGIEEDLMKCFEHTYMGDFKLSGRELRKKGINRIGNLLVPNKNYCLFEDWMTPLIEKMHDEQDESHIAWAKDVASSAASSSSSSTDLPERFVWTPSKIIKRLGHEINHESSVLYWAAKNDIPVFCPALTDGSVGDMLYFHSYKRKGFILDINEDIRAINDLAVQSHATGQIIIGGGLVKHHVCNANLMRNGANYSVYINTGQEFDGSDSGASPDEAISWGKIRIDAKPVKVSCDATIVWPLIVSQTFAKDVEEWKESSKDTVCWHT
jgi:deoxyhypusine synthase